MDRLQLQIKVGLDPAMAVETLLTLEAGNDPIAHLVRNAADKSPTFESWLPWCARRLAQELSSNKKR
jgi:hypothetical protein